MMEQRILGNTGLKVSRLGAGLAEIGYELTFSEQDQAAQVLNIALDHGINYFDTAACYGISEALIGRTVAHRRSEYSLATKCGHVVDGYQGEPWTAQTITDSIDRSLQRLQTDYLDLIQLHSCGLEILQQGEVIEALLKAKAAGKTRFIDYSGDNDEAFWAIDSGYFDTLQTSFNLVDQHARKGLLSQAKTKGLGVIIKRPIANAIWGVTTPPESYYTAPYFERARQMKSVGPLPGAPTDPIALALGFVWSHDEVDKLIVGTSNPQQMQANIDLVNQGLVLAEETRQALYQRFDQLGRDWTQQE
jgi:aryl-alcohol dehydrogenase-like predicted oxidoreductase